MKLSQAVVVVNEYTIKGADGSGSRGSTPGEYVMRYMAREGASETASSALVKDMDRYVTKYMARHDAAASLSGSAPKQIRKAGGLGGVAFSESSLSLPEEDLRRRSKNIQEMFDKGHTVLKTVLSFDTAYLKENGVVSEDFAYRRPGDFKGEVDQARLREAIRHGLSKIMPDYDDLRYVGVIQMDTAHVHCHLALCDFGPGNRTRDGTQKGKLSAAQMEKIRRGVDLCLDETKEVQSLSRYADLEQRNIKTALKRYTYDTLLLYGAPQKLLTHLPEDTKLWRAGSNRQEMRAANRICRDYVERVFSSFPEKLEQAEEGIRRYAETRMRRENLTDAQSDALYQKGRENLTKECMDGIYATLRSIPPSRRKMQTPFLDLSASPYLKPDGSGGMQDVVYRMGSYGKRFLRHRKASVRMREFADSYEKARDAGKAAPGSEVLYRFFQIEQSYHEQLAEKYSGFLFAMPPSDSLMEEYRTVQEKAEKAENFRRFLADASASRMKPEQAERYGRDAYGIYGGKFLASSRPKMEKRCAAVTKQYTDARTKFDTHLAAAGLGVQMDKDGRPMFVQANRYRFEDIRALDLHELRGDFDGPLQYDKKAERDFLQMAKRRTEAYQDACAYLDGTGQSAMRSVFDEADIRSMAEAALRIRNNKPIPPTPAREAEVPKRQTVKLDLNMHRYLSGLIEEKTEEAAKEPALVVDGPELS